MFHLFSWKCRRYWLCWLFSRSFMRSNRYNLLCHIISFIWTLWCIVSSSYFQHNQKRCYKLLPFSQIVKIDEKRRRWYIYHGPIDRLRWGKLFSWQHSSIFTYIDVPIRYHKISGERYCGMFGLYSKTTFQQLIRNREI